MALSEGRTCLAALFFGNPAIRADSPSPVALRPSLTTGLPLSEKIPSQIGWNAVYASSMPERLTGLKEIACPFFESD